MEHTKAYQEFKKNGNTKFVRYSEGAEMYNMSVSSVDDYKEHEKQMMESRQYSVEELFCSGYARFFWEAIKLRYPEYCFYVDIRH